MKEFILKPGDIRPLAPDRGDCLATDYITVDGEKVRFLYREEPEYEGDSGWRFFSGLEDDDYIDDPDNSDFFDINDICNIDPTIIPLLDLPPGTAMEFDEKTGRFSDVDNSEAR